MPSVHVHTKHSWALLLALMVVGPMAAQPLCDVLLRPAFHYSTDGLTLIVDDSSTTYGVIADRSWSFGDGSSVSTGSSHQYSAPGVYEVCLTLSSPSVDCIVTNHDLVLADLALGGGAILPAPEDTIYVFDEGHHLPQKALNHFAHHSRMISTSKWLDQCNKSLGAMLGVISGAGNVDRYGEQLPAALIDCKQRLDQL